MVAKLYFRYGAVDSSKTSDLLQVRHNYLKQKKHVLLVKPAIDTRMGDPTLVFSRVGISAKADIIASSSTNLFGLLKNMDGPISCVLVDEVQFFTVDQIEQLRHIATFLSIPVICYGLRTTYKGELFEASARLFALADSLEEMKNTCWFCNRKSIMSLKVDANGKAVRQGSSEPEVGFEDKYLPTCYFHFQTQL